MLAERVHTTGCRREHLAAAPSPPTPPGGPTYPPGPPLRRSVSPITPRACAQTCAPPYTSAIPTRPALAPIETWGGGSEPKHAWPYTHPYPFLMTQRAFHTYGWYLQGSFLLLQITRAPYHEPSLNAPVDPAPASFVPSLPACIIILTYSPLLAPISPGSVVLPGLQIWLLPPYRPHPCELAAILLP